MSAAAAAEDALALQTALQARVDAAQCKDGKAAAKRERQRETGSVESSANVAATADAPGEHGQQTAELAKGSGHLHRFGAGSLLAQWAQHAICARPDAVEAQLRLCRHLPLRRQVHFI